MSDMSSGRAESFAKDVTICAIEHGLIPACTDAKDSARQVLDFYNAICDGVKKKEA